MAQTANQNYTKTTTYREAGGGRPAVSITYFDSNWHTKCPLRVKIS